MTKVSKIKRTIEEKIKKNFPDAKFKIEDTSFKHRSHIQNKFRKELIQIIKILRSPEGCNWDKEQTHKSLIPYLVEETYEVIEAINLSSLIDLL